ncbi:MAG: CHASE2 domain-containing protein [Alphaproteobacteria bacterium]|jgi:class 3 adenylate cyclase|nr:CHASE2 domain-containing protein [Alphaproteobacteria bacterium]
MTTEGDPAGREHDPAADGPGSAAAAPRRSPMRLQPAEWLISAIAVLLVTAVIVVLPRVFAPAAALETVVDDVRVSFFAPAEPQRDEIVIIAITEETLATFPYRSPIDRGFLADLIRLLEERGVRAIGLDILIDQPTEPEKDERLRRLLIDSPVPIVAATVLDPFPLTERQRAYHEAYVRQATTGFVNLAKDAMDGVVRRHIPLLTEGGGVVPSFSARLALVLGHRIPFEPLRIDWHGTPDAATPPFPVYPAHTLSYLPSAWIEDRVALIGMVAPGIDEHRTPLSILRGALPGVEVHAHSLAQLLSGRQAIPAVGLWPEVAIVLILAAAGAGLAMLRTSFWVMLMPSLGVLCGFWVAGFAGYSWGAPMAPLILPSLAFVLAAGIESGVLSGRHRRKSRTIREAFSRYVSPTVVARLEQKPETLRIGGTWREITVLFTDLEGFTVTARQLQPNVLADMLNEYLDGMFDTVMKHEGTLDKFVGDAILAFFGAPEAQADHAERAVACALAMDRFAEAFRSDQVAAGRPLGRTRIGVHSGEALVGNFGGKARFNYTAIGDTVNTCSRLESANRHLGTRLIVSAATATRCPGRRFRPIGDLLVKGRQEPVSTLQPVVPGGFPAAFLDAYDDAFRLLDEDPEAAQAAFERLAAEAPDDPPVALHLHRLRHGMPGRRIVLTEK